MSTNHSRRSFLKTSAAVATAATFANLGSNFAWAAGSDIIRVGLIGCGGRGTGAAFDCAKASPAVQIVAMGDLFKDRLENSRNQLRSEEGRKAIGGQCQVSDDMCFVGFDACQKVIDSGVDLVLLCTPPGFRPSHYKAAIDADKHVFMEKPVAVDPAGVRSVLATSELASKKGLGVMSGTCFRHQVNHIENIKRIHDGEIGEIVAGQCYYNVGYLWSHPRQPGWTDTEWQIRNWLYFTWLSGDLIVEQNIHRLDIMNWVMKNHPVSAYGMGGRQVRTDPAYGNIYDHFAVEYEFPGGVRITDMCRQIDGTDSRIAEQYIGTKGICDPANGFVGEPKQKIVPLGQAYVQEHRDLLESIAAGKPVNEGRQVAESTLTAIMGRMSAYTGKLVTWEQAMKSELSLFPEKLEFGEMPVPPVAMPGKDKLV
jgi:predicted dehydrogenase